MSKISKVIAFTLTALVAIEFFHRYSLANPRYHWKTFTRLDGLAGNNVRAILQYSNGDIWFATSAGVSRFNELWQRYTKAEGLADNDVIGMVEANDGSLWFATRNGISVAFINPELPFEQPIFKSFSQNDGLIDNQILAITKDTEGNIWVGTPSGVSKFNKEGQEGKGEYWENHQEAIFPPVDGGVGGGLLSRGVTAICAASGGFVPSGSQQMWFGIRSSATEFSAVSRFDGINWVVFTTADGIPNGNINSIVEDSIGNIWIATSNGAARFDGNKWDTFTVADGLTGNNVQTIMVDKQWRLWFGTNGGVNVIDMAWSVLERPFENSWQITTKDGIVSDNIQAILADGNGRLWLGTSSRGVNFSDRSWQIFTTESGLADNSITAITEDKIGNLWVGTLNGLCRNSEFGIRNSEFGISNSEGWEIFTIADGLPGNEIRSLTVDKSGNVWVGTDKGIGVFNGIGFRQYTQSDGLSSNSVHTLATDSAGNIWAGTGVFIGEPDPFERFVGLNKFDGTNWFRIPALEAIASTLFEDSGGNIWIGTFRDGIRVLNNDVVQKFTITEGLASNTVSSIIEDSAGRIWVGTANGISILSNDDQPKGEGTSDFRLPTSDFRIWMTLTTDDGLIDNRVQSLFRSSTGEIWIGTASGVSVVSEDTTSLITHHSSLITVTDGLASNDIGTILESSDGSLWLGSNDGNGLTRYVREKIAPRTRITSGPRGIVGERSVTFEYEGGDASTPKDELSYSYRIDLDNWSPFTKRTIVTFSNLDDKKEHEFVVRARDKYGNTDLAGANARFYVDAEPPFVKITDPTDNQVIGRIYDIIGTATDGDFKEYKIQGSNFVEKSSKPIEDGILAHWDTKNLADGNYTILLTAWDTKNGEYDNEHTNSDRVRVIVDNTKPKVEIISPKTGEPRAGRIEIVALLEDIHLYSYTLKYKQARGNIEEERQIHFETSEVFKTSEVLELKYTWDSSNVYGKATLILEAQDKAGNVGVAEITLDLENDTANPITQITQPTIGQVISKDIDIIGTADDSTLVEFTLEYSSVPPSLGGVGGGEVNPIDYKLIKRSTFPINNDILAVWNTVNIPDGNYILRLKAEDDNGYSNETTVPIKIDNTPPIASIKFPTNGETLSSSSRTEILGVAMDANFDRYILEYAQQPAGQWNLISDSNEPINEGVLGSWNTSGFDREYFLKLTVWDKAGLSNSDSIMIILDDIFPSVQISSPREGEIISGIVEIVGTAEDDNFGYYKVDFQKESDGREGEAPEPWQEILLNQTSRTTPQKNSLLALWNTLEGASPLNGDYVIRLTAFDKSEHEKSVERTVIVDNKAPEVFISQPVNYQQVGAGVSASPSEVRIIGTADDENFAEYVIEYGPGEAPPKWDSVAETPFLKGVRDNLLTVWNTQGKAGKYTIRLNVIDKAQHQGEARIIVNVKEPILRSTGGEATDNSSKAKIIIPPNSLSTSTVITINPVQNIHVCPAPSGFAHTGIAYDFEPKAARFNKIKPATITIYYPNSINLSGDDNPLTPFGKGDETLALLFWNEKGQIFQLIGGTVDKSKRTVAVPVTKLGRYALMWVESVPNNGTNASLSDLACQPRVFSPKRGESTRISFRLSQPSDVTVKIYNMAGRLQRILQKQRPMPQEWQTLVWEGRDENQQIVPGGPYIITVTVADKSIQKSVIVWND
ncbi:hypothetical protein FJZ31_16380 [Candidatus Poribacteria bacterium]|nr:hypothetical protein [Candidatus Poribacteria bacterium]